MNLLPTTPPDCLPPQPFPTNPHVTPPLSAHPRPLPTRFRLALPSTNPSWPHPPGWTTSPGPPTSPAPPSQGPALAETPPPEARGPPPHLTHRRLPSPRRVSRGGFSISFLRTRGKEPGRPLSPAARPGPGPGPACGSTGGFFPPPASDIVPRARLARASPRLASPARLPAPQDGTGPCDPPQLPTQAATAQARRGPPPHPSLHRRRTGSGLLIIHKARPASPDGGLGLAHPARGGGSRSGLPDRDWLGRP